MTTSYDFDSGWPYVEEASGLGTQHIAMMGKFLSILNGPAQAIQGEDQGTRLTFGL